MRYAVLLAWLGLPLLVGSQAAGGPPEIRPLAAEPAAEGPAPGPGGQNKAFFYSGGKKIYLNNTGLGVAKLKADAPDVRRLPFDVMTVGPADDPLMRMSESLRAHQIVIVSTRTGERTLDLVKPTPEASANVEYVLPVVQTVHTPPTGRADQLILTPYVAVRFVNPTTTDQANDYLHRSELPLKVKSAQDSVPNGFVLQLQGVVRYDRLLDASNRLYEQGTADGSLLYSHPDFIQVKTNLDEPPPKDPQLPDQWHLQNKGQSGGTPGADVNALEAWKMGLGDCSVIVGIIDDGLEANHPDLVANFRTGRRYDGEDETYIN